jgi:hypothetical protein
MLYEEKGGQGLFNLGQTATDRPPKSKNAGRSPARVDALTSNKNPAQREPGGARTTKD